MLPLCMFPVNFKPRVPGQGTESRPLHLGLCRQVEVVFFWPKDFTCNVPYGDAEVAARI